RDVILRYKDNRVKFGIHYISSAIMNEPQPLKTAQDMARELDQMGYDYFEIGDHMQRHGVDTPTLLPTLIEAYGDMTFVSSIMQLPQRGPYPVAKFYRSFDLLTGGRIIAGVGTGSRSTEYELLGIDIKEMWPRFEEGV